MAFLPDMDTETQMKCDPTPIRVRLSWLTSSSATVADSRWIPIPTLPATEMT